MTETRTGSNTPECLIKVSTDSFLSSDRDSDVSYSGDSLNKEDDSSDTSLTEPREDGSTGLLLSGSDENHFQPNVPTDVISSKYIESTPSVGKGAESLVSLFPFSPPPKKDEHHFPVKDLYPTKANKKNKDDVFPEPIRRPQHQRQKTQRISNSIQRETSWYLSDDDEGSSTIAYRSNNSDEMTYLLSGMNAKVDKISPTKSDTITSIFQPLNVKGNEDKSERSETSGIVSSGMKKFIQKLKTNEITFYSLGGAVVSALFHIVFCLAHASAIHRPHSGRPVLGVMVRMAAVGPLVSGTIFICALGNHFAAMTPTVDVFPAPFFAQMAVVVDQSLVEAGLEDHDVIFLTTFGFLSALALILTGILIFVGTQVKLVNLSAYLPYPVMCGFFSSVGVLFWSLAFTVDTGEKLWNVLSGGSFQTMIHCAKHHAGSVVAGTLMSVMSKKNQKILPLYAMVPIALVYLGMAISGTSLKEAQEYDWFWSENDISVQYSWNNVDEIKWEVPMPFGVIRGVVEGKLHLPAVMKGLPIVVSMALIFFIRCSLHAPALRKTSNGLEKWKKDQENQNSSYGSERHEQDVVADVDLAEADLFNVYGKTLAINGLAGGFACLPGVGIAGTLFKIGAGGALPQFFSLLLLGFFYLTEFTFVKYLPKMTFSSLLVATSIDMVDSWFFDSYKKTLVKSEWVVTPLIVVATFLVGSLQSVALGLAVSTFIFVGTLNRSGVVKFISNGLIVHSITERNAEDAAWLDQNGDLIQVLVLQSYIFFGNANSCLSYVKSMFEEPEDYKPEEQGFHLPPEPKYLIIDMTLVVGMDTSSVDVFGDIIQMCYKKNCKIFLTGLHPALKKTLSLGGVRPSKNKKSENSVLLFPSDLERALCKAEDGLLKSHSELEQKELRRTIIRNNSDIGDGFLYALSEIDKQHDLNVMHTLAGLETYTEVVELKAGESLFHGSDGSLNEYRNRGLYFIEHGMLKVERDQMATTTRGSLHRKGDKSVIYAAPHFAGSNLSLTHLQCRTPSIGRESHLLKNVAGREKRTMRLARLKPGFVIGTLSGQFDDYTGDHVALTICRLHCLSYDKINEMEEKNPRLILELYKMMGNLSAKRQETTIDQLATLHQIMSSLAPSKPIDRMTMAAIRNTATTIPWSLFHTAPNAVA